MPTIAQNIVDTLNASGVRRVYGLAGDSLNGFTDAIRESDLDWIHVRHEETAAFAAAAEAATTGELTVCAGSCGPGNLHLINGVFDAQRSKSADAGHCLPHSLRRDWFRLLPGNTSAVTL